MTFICLLIISSINFIRGESKVVCGQPSVKQPVIGQDALPGMWPWQVALYNYNLQMCGGSLISEKWAITAAHCLRKYRRGWAVVLGENDRRNDGGFEQRINVKRYIPHPKYNSYNADNDIALLELEHPATLNERVKPICLPEPDERPADGTTCYLTGWGTTDYRRRLKRILQQNDLTIVNHTACRDLKYPDKITDQMMCGLHGPQSPTTGCHGDSGGPLNCQREDGRWVLQGSVSHGSAYCDRGEVFTVFARMAMFRAWIDNEMKAQCDFEIIVPEGGSGTFTTPNWPSPYPANSNCIWEVKSMSSTHKLKVMFQEFQLEKGGYGCQRDYIEVYEDDTLYGEFCGTDSDIRDSAIGMLFKARKSIKVVFKSDRWRNYQGFKAFYYYN